MVHRPSQIGVGKSDPAERRLAQDFSSGGLAASAKEESRLRAQIGVTPAIQDDSRDVPLGVEAGAGKHLRELLTDLPFIVPEGSSDHFCAALISLRFRR